MTSCRAAVVRCAVAVAVALAVSTAAALEGRAPSAKDRYDTAQQREAAARAAVAQVPAAADDAVIDRVVAAARRVVAAYEGVVRRFPKSGYSDNALFQAGALSQWLYARYGRAADRAAAAKYYAWLTREYPASPLRRQVRTALTQLETHPAAAQPAPAVAPAAPLPAGRASAPAMAARTASALPPPAAPPGGAAAGPVLRAIEREVLDAHVRIILALDRETPFAHEVLAGPPRAFVDLQGATVLETLKDATIPFDGDAVKQVRVGRRPEAVRVVLDLDAATKISVFTLYNPFRVVIDADRPLRPTLAPLTPADVPAPADVVLADETRLPAQAEVATPDALAPAATVDPAPAPSAPEVPASPLPPPVAPAVRQATPVPPPPAAPPAPIEARGPATGREMPAMAAAPARNADGTFSLARQLGLGISRIVIDPGHGGHDPGTPTAGTSEARLVLDIALRLEKLLVKDGFDVVLTRRTDVYVPLEQRTAIANREGADLFLSIHANSGRDPKARGVEVYYLSFASNPEAEAVAARENATSTGGMHNLSGIVRAIALNNKLDESRDLAQIVQQSLAGRLARANPGLRSRGVKKAPFVVLIGAEMPSVLAEIGFITNRQEVALLRTPAYRQRIAESLQAAVVQYQRSLKRQGAVATAER